MLRELLIAVGDVTRTFISSSGVPFSPGTVSVFEGLVYVVDLVEKWFKAREEDERESNEARNGTVEEAEAPVQREVRQPLIKQARGRPIPTITSSEPIVDRKSSFVGHACKIVDEEDVMAVVGHLLEDKRIARAAHPTIWAYRRVREVGGAAGRVVESGECSDWLARLQEPVS